MHHCTIAILGSNQPGAEVVHKLMDQFSTSALQLYDSDDAQEIRQLVSSEKTDILLADARMDFDNQRSADLVAEFVGSAKHLQAVVVGVEQKDLLLLGRLDRTILLPSDFTQDQLRDALAYAFSAVDAQLDRPFIVRTGRSDYAVRPSKICYVESNRRKLFIHVGEEVLTTYGKISDLQESLPMRFTQCHKSYLVNMGFIEKLEEKYVVLTTGERIPMSQKRRRQTRESFASYVGRVL